MKKTVFVLLNDYWHPRATIEPLVEKLFPEKDWFLRVTDDPNYPTAYFKMPDLLVNFKDGIANTQIPTSNWYGRDWAFVLERAVRGSGMGYLAVHCGTANIPEDHPAFRQVLRGRFLRHPPLCPVTFEPTADHPITRGVEPFTLNDEQYVVEFSPDAPTQVLGVSRSEHGEQPALWAHELGKGRVCGVTPGHTTENLLHPAYVKLLQNAVAWCAR